MMKLRLYFLLLISVTCMFLGSCNNEASSGKADNQASEEGQSVSINQISKQIESSPSAELFYRRAGLFMDSLKYNEALSDLEMAMQLDSTFAPTYLRIAQIYRKSNKIPLAYQFAKRAERLQLESDELFVLLAEIELIRKRYQEGIRLCNKALRINEKNPRAYYIKGYIYEESGDAKRASSSYQTCLEIDNAYADAYASLINLKIQQEEYDLASQYVESGLRFLPDNPFIWYNYGVLLQKQVLLDSALYAYNETLSRDSLFEFALYNKGLILQDQQKSKQAEEVYQRLIDINPMFVTAYLRLGEMLIKQQKYQEANDVLRKGLISNPKSEEIQKLYNTTKSKI